MTRETRAHTSAHHRIEIPADLKPGVTRSARRDGLTVRGFIERAFLREITFRRLAPKRPRASTS